VFLEQIGADERVREILKPYEAEGLELGRVSFAAHEQYRVFLESGEFEGAPAGRLRWGELLPAVGDWVAARRVDAELVLNRSGFSEAHAVFTEGGGRTLEEQVIAANVDAALVVCGLDGDFNLRRMERYLVLASDSGRNLCSFSTRRTCARTWRCEWRPPGASRPASGWWP